ncbi:MAG TPA: MFS transporter [Burkholderiales bacterium]|jgi:MFS family permease|nr:MFS transporter [Burkholderiales bacterium]
MRSRSEHAPAELGGGPGSLTHGTESAYAWARLVAAVLVCTIGGVGMWSVVVALPAVQAEFGVARGDASLPYTITMIGFGVGGILMGRLSDRHGIMLPVVLGTCALALGYVLASRAATLGQYAAAQGLLIGFGSSATFAPLMADTSLWFTRRRGIAVAIFASGSYLAGTVWPPVVQHFIDAAGWRQTLMGIAVFCVLSVLPMSLALRRRAPAIGHGSHHAHPLSWPARPLGLPAGSLQALLIIAGVACCVAMSMPQVHVVAYCTDLGYGAARGAQMLSLMLGCGIVSRLAFGWISDRIGGLRTLLLGSALQGIALLLFLPFDGLVSLYVISAMFGLFQGGIVPAYAIIIREFFPPREAGVRVGLVITATLFGMAFGGWFSGAIFDLTGSYDAAFVNGVLWNLLNLSIALWLLRRSVRRLAYA